MLASTISNRFFRSRTDVGNRLRSTRQKVNQCNRLNILHFDNSSCELRKIIIRYIGFFNASAAIKSLEKYNWRKLIVRLQLMLFDVLEINLC